MPSLAPFSCYLYSYSWHAQLSRHTYISFTSGTCHISFTGWEVLLASFSHTYQMPSCNTAEEVVHAPRLYMTYLNMQFKVPELNTSLYHFPWSHCILSVTAQQLARFFCNGTHGWCHKTSHPVMCKTNFANSTWTQVSGQHFTPDQRQTGLSLNLPAEVCCCCCLHLKKSSVFQAKTGAFAN